MKKILYYNWLQFDDKLYNGGGVNVYQNNLIQEMIKDSDYRVYFLSSGKAYDKNTRKAYIEETKNCYGEDCRTFQIVNSPILSSAKLSFYDVKTYLFDEELKHVIIEFINHYGRFDIIHFNNFEGLTLQTLKVKEYYPMTSFIYSLHNYYLFCPEVQLWQKNCMECRDFDNGKACVGCVPDNVWKWKVKKMHYLNRRRDKAGYSLLCGMLNAAERIRTVFKSTKKSAQKRKHLELYYNNYRVMNVRYFNKYIDRFLCVSQAVYRIAVNYGFDKNKCLVQYIGTEYASQLRTHKKYRASLDYITIAYLGDANVYKGFFFLLDAMEMMPGELAKKMNVVICARNIDKSVHKRINDLIKKYHGIRISDGYLRTQLPLILENVDLGIVPVLWEDNLPQIAIEYTAYGVPVLASSLGGAHELSRDNDFYFEAGNHEQFIDRLFMFQQEPQKLMNYWSSYRGLLSMEQHATELKGYYEDNRYEGEPIS